MKQVKLYSYQLFLLLLIALLGTGLSVFLYSTNKGLEKKNVQSVFKRLAEERIQALNKVVSESYLIVESVSALYDSSQEITREEFSTFVKPFLKHYPCVQALEWIPKIPHNQRAVYEQKVRQDGFAGFEIKEKNFKNNTIERAAKRNEYFPVYFVEPLEGNEIAVGFDQASNSTRLETLRKAMASGVIAATGKVVLVQEKENVFGFLLFKPQYAKNLSLTTLEERREHLVGFVLGVFRVKVLFDTALQFLNPVGINIRIFDRSSHDKDQLLYDHTSRTLAGSSTVHSANISFLPGFSVSEKLKVADRTWEIACTPTADFIKNRVTGQARVVLIVGLILTVGFCCITWLFMRQAVTARQHAEQSFIAWQKLKTEILERENTEKLLHRSQEQWERTFNSMNDIITIQNQDMHILQANKATFDFFQLEKEDVIGKHCYEFFRGASTPCPNCPELSTLDDNANHSANITHENLGKIFNVTSSPIMDENREFQHIVHIAKDITEHKKMEAELFQAHKMEAIGTLAGGIAHDFNNILAVIFGYAEMAKIDLPDGSSTKDDINQVLKAANRAKELVKQILTFSRKGQETQQPMQPTPVIKEALKLMRASLPTTIEIQEEIDPDCGAIIANPTNVHQVLVNLCTNALHAMEEEKGILTVKLTRAELTEHDVIHESGVSEGPFVELMISDTGCGMDKKTVERIFEPYFTTKEVGKGTGMGLALVHGIVEGCGGFIKIESEPNKGTTFHVYFPAIKEKAVEVEEEQQEPLPRGDERILAVDDEEVIVGMYQATLERLGYKITTYSNSEKTLEVFQSSPDNFDLIITDQTMPHLPGSELAKKILQIRPDIPIIMCTGYSSMISEEKAREIGIKKFVMKPVERKTLAKIVREVLDKSKS